MKDTYSQTNFLVQYRDNVTSRAGKFSLITNNFYEIYTYVYGEGPYFYFVNDKIYAIEPGTVLFLRPGVLIGSCKKKTARYTRLVCRIPTYAFDFIEKLEPSLFSFLSNSDVSIMKPEGRYKEEYFSYVEQLKKMSESVEEHGATLMFSVVLKMLNALSKMSEADGAAKKQSKSDELILRIISMINQEYASITSVAELAERMNYSKNYISQYFRSHTDIGLHDFLIMKKLSAAAVKLAEGKNVTDAAMECGFGSTAYFISIFKTRYGITPGKYASKYR